MALFSYMAYRNRGCVQGARYCAPTGAGQGFVFRCRDSYREDAMQRNGGRFFFIATYCTLLCAMVADCTNGLGGCRNFAVR